MDVYNVKSINGQSQTFSEEKLWSELKAGSEPAFIAIYDKYVRILYKYGIRIVSDEVLVKDAIQELFIDVWRNKTGLGPTTSVKYYFFAALRRRLLRALKQNNKNSFFEDMPVESYEDYETTLIKEQIQTEKKKKILTELDKLTPRQREAVFLRYLEELEYEEVADIMSVSVQSVYNLITQAINNIKKNIINLTPSVFLFAFL